MEKIITIKLHNASREEVEELKTHLEEECWDWKEEVVENNPFQSGKSK